MAKPRVIASPDDARRELGLRPAEKAGIYVVRGEAGIWDARHFKAGDQIPRHYVYSHERDPHAIRVPTPQPKPTKAVTA